MAEDDDLQIQLVWVGLDETPVLMANQVICQFIGPGEFVLSFGQAVPPPLLGTLDENEKMLRSLSHVAAKPLARLSMSESTFRQVIEVLTSNLSKYEEAQRKMGE